VIRLDAGPGGRLRVIGSLEEPALELLRRAISRGAVVLDLSEVEWADESAVRLLAGLPPERCTVSSCPTWLALWVEQVRDAHAGRAGHGRSRSPRPAGAGARGRV
jgi:hypothetical protein